MSSVTISGDLIGHVRLLLKMSLDDAAQGKALVEDGNAFSSYASVAYILTVAAVEAFLNENYLFGVFCRSGTKESALWRIPDDVREKLDLLVKLELVADLMFGKRLPRGEQPMQDFAVLIKLRNALTHYKMGMHHPDFVQKLRQEKLLLPLPKHLPPEDTAAQPWVWEISTISGVIWAHNTAAAVVQRLVACDEQDLCNGSSTAGNFPQLDARGVRAYLNSLAAKTSAKAEGRADGRQAQGESP